MEPELPHIYTVSSLTREIRERLETHFPLVWVSGEVSNLRSPISGHLYFTLKDGGAQLRAVLFKGNHLHLRYKPAEGGQVLCRGRITVYEARGDYQLIVDYVEPLGMGALAQAFEALKARLAAEGLFDSARKRPLPAMPRRLALVTSPTGAVVWDFLRLQKQRFPRLEILIYPVKVQGTEAAGEIAAALGDLQNFDGLDVIILARGGGSLEELWPFNEERVARAIAASAVPVVSAVGHEVDFTIADFVADLRAPTPSAAVALVLPDSKELTGRLTRLAGSLYRGWRRHLDGERRHLDQVRRRLPNLRQRLVEARLRLDDRSDSLRRRLGRRVEGGRQRLRLAASRLLLLSPRRLLTQDRPHLATMASRLWLAWRRRQQELTRHVDYCASHLAKLDPAAILARGYAVATKLPEGVILRDAAQAPAGSHVRVRLAQGKLDCQVTDVAEN